MQVRKYRWHTALMSNVEFQQSVNTSDAITLETIVNFVYLSSKYFMKREREALL